MADDNQQGGDADKAEVEETAKQETAKQETAKQEAARAADLEAKKKTAKDSDGAGEDQDPEADAHGMVSMPKDKFEKRIARASASVLRELFGTADRDKIAEMKRRHDELEKQEGERSKKDEADRRAKLKEEERLREDNQKLAREKQELQDQLLAQSDETLIERQDAVVQGLAAQHVDQEFAGYAADRFKRHLRGLSNQEVAKMSEEDVGEWFQKFAERHPRMAKPAAAKEPEAGKEATTKEVAKKAKDDEKVAAERDAARKKSLADTRTKALRPPAVKRFEGKVLTPGRVDSMTAAEAAEYRRARGINAY